MNEKLKLMYEAFKKDIPAEAIQEKKVGVQHTSGYMPGYIVDRANDVLFALGLTWELEIVPIVINGISSMYMRTTQTASSGKETDTVTVCVTLKIKDGNDIIASHQAFGGCHILNNSLGDSLKGAQTDAMKKAWSYFGLGNRAYMGGIDDQLIHYSFIREKLISDLVAEIERVHGEDVSDSFIIETITTLAQRKTSELTNISLDILENVYDELKNLKSKETKVEKERGTRKVKAASPRTEIDSSLKEDDIPPF